MLVKYWIKEKLAGLCKSLLKLCDVLTLSKSLLMVLRKWSEGFIRDGQGNPLRAKNCKKRNAG